MGVFDGSDLMSSFNSNNEIGNHCVSVGILTSCFWLLQNVAQRSFGSIGMHAGRGGLLLSAGVGLLSTTCNLGLAQYADKALKPHVVDVVSKFNSQLPDMLKVRPAPYRYITNSRREKKESIKRMLLGISLYTLLERQSFYTAFPSSVIEMGVFANSWTARYRSVLSTSEVATPSQRMAIQKLGAKYGCHQCGSKQVFTAETFIADHMPPTKFVREANEKWWRKFFNMKMGQRLWPQCRKCFQQQGQAVRQSNHVPIYHPGLNPYHLAPACAYLLCQNTEVSRALDSALEPIITSIERIEKQVRKSFGK